MIFIDELDRMKIYKKSFYLPINTKNKLKNNVVLLLTPDYESTINLLKNQYINLKYYNSYYLERNTPYIINNEGYIDTEKTDNLINEVNIANPTLSNPNIGNNNYKHDMSFNKKLEKHLKMAMKEPEYQLDKISDEDRNKIGYKGSRADTKKGKKVIDDDKVLNKDKVEINTNEERIYIGNHNTFYETLIDEDNNKIVFITEENKIVNNKKLKEIMYLDRIKTNRDLFVIYDLIKEDIPEITNTYSTLERYKNKNLIIDTFYYNNIFLRKNIFKNDKGVTTYFDLLKRLLDDVSTQSIGYNKAETVLVPLEDWIQEGSLDYKESINLLSTIIRLVKLESKPFLQWKGIDFVFISRKGYFKCDLSELSLKNLAKFRLLIDKLTKDLPLNNVEKDDGTDSKKVIKAELMDKLDKSPINMKITTNYITGKNNPVIATDSKDASREELMKKVDKAVAISKNTDDAIKNLEDDEYTKKIINQLIEDEDNGVKLSNARVSRLLKAKDKSQEKVIQGRKIKDILEQPELKELPTTKLNIDTVNSEWEELKYINFENAYDIQQDIMDIIYSFSNMTKPVVPIDISVEDTSTSEDYVYTYTVNMEDSYGKRFKLKFDIPKFIDNKFMRLRGNEKTINGQLTFIGIVKTDEDTAQIISNYKKIFVYRYGSSLGKSCTYTDKIVKFLNKYEGKEIKVSQGNNSLICSKYELPIDYLDLASAYNTIETPNYIFYFNIDTMKKLYKIKDDPNSIPIAYNKKDNRVEYWNGYHLYSARIYEMIHTDLETNKCTKALEMFDSIKFAKKFTYSRANILNHKIPVIVIMAHSEGLEKSLKRANVNYYMTEKRPSQHPGIDIIKFKDGYLVYDIDYNSTLLMNGLKECDTENYSITEINNKTMWLDFLEIFGGRILSDGLDNFYDLMVDPITKETLERFNLPTEYCDLLAYSNFLLADNKYIRHTDNTARRYRSNELIAGYTYQALAESYGAYKTELKKRGTGTMTIKQSAIIDKIMLDPTCADLSMLNDIQNAESINSISYKGLAGLNHDRSYDLEKRGYDTTMLNNLAMSTGFSGNVGVTRQATIDMNIEGKRGYIKTIDNDVSKLSITKTFGVTEGMTPFGSTRDDPMRSAMNFIQTNKHGMRVKKSMPLLISNGTDMALPYITSNVFSFNAKQDGKVLEVTDEYMILQYKDGTKEFVDLRTKIRKNSNGGFFQTIKLDTDLKKGNTFKTKDVVAYDRSSYSNKLGPTKDLAYSNWTLCKVAMLTSDENFEDSAIITEWLSDAMASNVVIQKDVTLPKNTNIYQIVEKGQLISEGDPLIIFQNAFEDEDITLLLKNLGDEEDIVTDLGRIPVKSKVTGRVADVKIYRTCEKEELSDSLKKIVNKVEKPTKELEKVLKNNQIYEPGTLESTDSLDNVGKLKNVDDGVLIEFYLEYEDKLSIGDKIIYGNGCKGVNKHVIPKGQEMYSSFRPDECVHTIVPYYGLANRLICSVPITIGINKIIVELDRAVKDLCDIPYKFIDEM